MISCAAVTDATTSEEEIARQYHIPIPPELDLPISYNIAPTQDVLAIRFNRETNQRTLKAFRRSRIALTALARRLLSRRRVTGYREAV
jgi:hypothetical protein